jgi:uncharacterized YccA/Bax inhibitor family protein
MRNTLIALIVGVVVLVGGFFVLARFGGGLEPQTEEVRVDVTDQLSR